MARRALAIALVDVGKPDEAKKHAEAAVCDMESALAIHPFWLTFESFEVERVFSEKRAMRAANQTRVCLALGLAELLLSFVYIVNSDEHEVPNKGTYVAMYSVSSLICVLSFAGTFHKVFVRFTNVALAACITALVGMQIANLILLLHDSEIDFEGEDKGWSKEVRNQLKHKLNVEL